MIGFYGVISSEKILKKSRLNAFEKMSTDIDHEDFKNICFSGENYSIGLTVRKSFGNKDLSIIKNGNTIIAFSGYGKFYGEKKLFWAKEMANRILLAFEKESKDALVNIEGSFECLIYKNSELIIISDRFGSKNLYYYDTKNVFVFASDVGRIVSSGLVLREKNINAAQQFIVSSFFLDDTTLVKNIFRFPYASIMNKKITENSYAVFNRYWNLPKKEGEIDKITPDLVETFSKLMQQAVYELSDLEERAFVSLSGGLDSRAIFCFLSAKQKIKAVSYGEEISTAKKICRHSKTDLTLFHNTMHKENLFRNDLYKLISHSKVHAVLNQFFIMPKFKSLFQNDNNVAIYDGIYLDIFFSAPYVFQKFDYNIFSKTYGTAGIVLKQYSNINISNVNDLIKKKYLEISGKLDGYDDIRKSEIFYLNGRLRRYVNETLNSKESYCYVFKPGFNYELADFAYKLDLKLRKGKLYTTMLFKNFPEVMKIRYKDSYGNRNKILSEKISDYYRNMHNKLSSITYGKIQYHVNGPDVFFLGQKMINEYKNILPLLIRLINFCFASSLKDWFNPPLLIFSFS